MLVDTCARVSIGVKIRDTEKRSKSIVSVSSEIFLIRIYAAFCSLIGSSAGVHCLPFSDSSIRGAFPVEIFSALIFSRFPKYIPTYSPLSRSSPLNPFNCIVSFCTDKSMPCKFSILVMSCTLSFAGHSPGIPLLIFPAKKSVKGFKWLSAGFTL